MKINFSKYQGTGNDFIMLNNLKGIYDELSIPQIQFLCDRKFGIGADGLIKISNTINADFEMDYYNSDGSKSFCGNGARCSVKFAESIGLDVFKTSFLAIDGRHQASLSEETVSLKMNDVRQIKIVKNDFEIYTGSPHYIKFVENSLDVNVVEEGKKIRYAMEYNEKGINVNFVEILSENELEVATYERGVENETLSCGTGVVASAIAYASMKNLKGNHLIRIHTKGGKLYVSLQVNPDGSFFNINLIGPATFVFEGEIEVE
jgi:diaminopimelate epimerase